MPHTIKKVHLVSIPFTGVIELLDIIFDLPFVNCLAATVINYTPINNQRVQVNSTAFLHCDSTYNPTLDLTYDWWHNNFQIKFERLRIGPGNIAYFEYDEHYSRVSQHHCTCCNTLFIFLDFTANFFNFFFIEDI